MFKDVLRQLRDKNGITQEQLAEILGVTAGTIGNYEQGQRLPKDDKMWIKIANYFNVSVDYLMDVDGTINNAQTISEYNKSKKEPTVLAYSGNERIDSIAKLLFNSNIDDSDLNIIEAVLDKYKR